MRRDRLVSMAAFSLALLAAARGIEARTVRLGCRDGVPPPRTLCAAGCVRENRCDIDGLCNGACEFAIRVCQTCTLLAVPEGCPSIGCTCQ